MGRWGQFVETRALKRVMMLLDVTVMNKKSKSGIFQAGKLCTRFIPSVRMRCGCVKRDRLEIEYYL